MFDGLRNIHPIFFLLVATTLEVSGDAIVRMGIYNHAGAYRLVLFAAGMLLLFGYGAFLNLAPVEFGQVVGLYSDAVRGLADHQLRILPHPAHPTDRRGRCAGGERRPDHHLLEALSPAPKKDALER